MAVIWWYIPYSAVTIQLYPFSVNLFALGGLEEHSPDLAEYLAGLFPVEGMLKGDVTTHQLSSQVTSVLGENIPWFVQDLNLSGMQDFYV